MALAASRWLYLPGHARISVLPCPDTVRYSRSFAHLTKPGLRDSTHSFQCRPQSLIRRLAALQGASHAYFGMPHQLTVSFAHADTIVLYTWLLKAGNSASLSPGTVQPLRTARHAASTHTPQSSKLETCTASRWVPRCQCGAVGALAHAPAREHMSTGPGGSTQRRPA